MTPEDLKPGVTMYVALKQALTPQGRRSRGGQVFVEGGERVLHVVPNDARLKPDDVTVPNAKLILADDALVVSDKPAFNIHTDHARLQRSLDDANTTIAAKNTELTKANADLATARASTRASAAAAGQTPLAHPDARDPMAGHAVPSGHDTAIDPLLK